MCWWNLGTCPILDYVHVCPRSLWQGHSLVRWMRWHGRWRRPSCHGHFALSYLSTVVHRRYGVARGLARSRIDCLGRRLFLSTPFGRLSVGKVCTTTMCRLDARTKCDGLVPSSSGKCECLDSLFAVCRFIGRWKDHGILGHLLAFGGSALFGASRCGSLCFLVRTHDNLLERNRRNHFFSSVILDDWWFIYGVNIFWGNHDLLFCEVWRINTTLVAMLMFAIFGQVRLKDWRRKPDYFVL